MKTAALTLRPLGVELVGPRALALLPEVEALGLQVLDPYEDDDSGTYLVTTVIELGGVASEQLLDLFAKRASLLLLGGDSAGIAAALAPAGTQVTDSEAVALAWIKRELAPIKAEQAKGEYALALEESRSCGTCAIRESCPFDHVTVVLDFWKLDVFPDNALADATPTDELTPEPDTPFANPDVFPDTPDAAPADVAATATPGCTDASADNG